MAKKILILEASSTMQKIFTNTLDSKQYTIRFEAEAKAVLSALIDFCPD